MRCFELLQRLGLAEIAFQPAAGLPFGTLKRVEIARALAGDAKLLMLDEPAGGLTHAEVDDLGELIKQLRDDYGLTILLVEHHMAMVMGISDKVVVLDFGRKIAEGTPAAGRHGPDGHRGLPGRAVMGDTLLEVRGLTARYGAVEVLHGIDFDVERGEVVVVLGANGAGKTTTLRAICQMVDDGRLDHARRQGADRPGRPPRSCGSASPTCRRAGAPSTTSRSRTTCSPARTSARTRRSRRTSSAGSTMFPRLRERR